MTYSITKAWKFSAAHALDHLPPDHKCHALHGHNYRVDVSLTVTFLEVDGFVVDYGVLNEDLGLWIAQTLDHTNLNDLLPLTSAERLAKHIYDQCSTYDWGHLVDSVTVAETDGTTATYTP